MDRCFWADGYSDDGDDTELSSAQLTDLWESFFFFFGSNGAVLCESHVLGLRPSLLL